MASVAIYFSNLNSDDRKKYEKKLITADGTVLPDPYTLEVTFIFKLPHLTSI